jgi:hypothetical protein
MCFRTPAAPPRLCVPGGETPETQFEPRSMTPVHTSGWPKVGRACDLPPVRLEDSSTTKLTFARASESAAAILRHHHHHRQQQQQHMHQALRGEIH